MRRLIASAAVAATLVVAVPLHAADNLLLSRFADYLEALRVQTGIPGLAAVVVTGNDVSWERAFGYQDVDRLVRTEAFTPFHLDGVTQTLTATFVLRCAEGGRVSLDDKVFRYAPGSPDANATVRQVLSHTAETGAFSYQLSRLDVLKKVVESCEGSGSFRSTFAQILNDVTMNDSVPGPDVVSLPPNTTLTQSAIDHYRNVLSQLAVPYAVDKGHPSRSQYPSTSLAAGSGLVSTARDYAKFDVALRTGALVRESTLSTAWSAVNGRFGLGWFVQSYNNEKVVWAFGQGDNASSSLVVTLPARATTLILVANSDGLSKGFGLENGDINASPFGKLFLGLFVK